MHFTTNQAGMIEFSPEQAPVAANKLYPSMRRSSDPSQESMSIDEHLSTMPIPPSPHPVPLLDQPIVPQPGHGDIQQWLGYEQQNPSTSMISGGGYGNGGGGGGASSGQPQQHHNIDEMLIRMHAVQSVNNNVGDMKEIMDTHVVHQQQMKNEPLDPTYPLANLGQCMQMQGIDILGSPYAAATGSARSNSEGSISGLSALNTRRSSRASHDGLLRCGYCPKKWSGNEALQQHMEECKNDRTHECGLCKKRFKARGGLQQHMRIHNQERPYECKQCMKRFTQKSHIDQHMRIHTGEKPFACQYCGRSFRQRSQQQGHESTHLNQLMASQHRAATLNLGHVPGTASTALLAGDCSESALNLSHHATNRSPHEQLTVSQANISYPSIHQSMMSHSGLIGLGGGDVSSLLTLQSGGHLMQSPVTIPSSTFQPLNLIDSSH